MPSVDVVKILRLNPNKSSEILLSLKKEKIQNSFLFDSIKNELYFYKIDENRRIFEFCGVCFLLINSIIDIDEDRDLNNKQKQKLFKFQADYQDVICKNGEENFAFLFDQDCSNPTVSMALRNSKALLLNHSNSYDNSDLRVVFDSGNLAVLNKIKTSSKDKFERFLLLFVLALAYNEKIFEFLEQTSNAYNEKNFEKMVEIRDEILKFDLNAYFDNPVKPANNQSYKIFKIISNELTTKELHNELKSQISNLVQAIYEKQKSKQDKKITIFGLIISVLSLIVAVVAIIK